MITKIPQFTAAFAKTSNALLSIEADAITGIPFKAKGWRLMHLFYKTSSYNKITLIGIQQVE
jgi:hypothetical protein